MEMATEEQKLERHKLVIEIMALAYAFQQLTDHCVFIDWSGHVDSLTVEVRESKERYQSPLAETAFYTHGRWEQYRKDEDPNFWLKVKRDVLKEALDSRDVPYQEMEQVADTVYRYAF